MYLVDRRGDIEPFRVADINESRRTSPAQADRAEARRD
jgi:hypothetical protein